MLKRLGNALKWILPLIIAALAGTALPALLPAQIALMLAGALALVWALMWLIERLGKPPPEKKKKAKSEDKEEMPTFYALNGKLFTDPELTEEITPANWPDYKPKQKKKKKGKNAPAKAAEVTLWADTALVMERGGRYARVIQVEAAEEEYAIYAKENLRAVIDLRPQVRTEPALEILTSDGVPILFGLGVSFQIMRDDDVQSETTPYFSREDAVIAAAYRPPVPSDGDQTPWDEAPLDIATVQLQYVVSEYTLNDLFDYTPAGSDPPRQRIARKVDEATRSSLIELGIHLNSAFLLEMTFDQRIAQTLEKMWITRSWKTLEQRTAITTAVTQAQAATQLITPVARAVQALTHQSPPVDHTLSTQVDAIIVKVQQFIRQIEVTHDYINTLSHRIADHIASLATPQDLPKKLLEAVRLRQHDLQRRIERLRTNDITWLQGSPLVLDAEMLDALDQAATACIARLEELEYEIQEQIAEIGDETEWVDRLVGIARLQDELNTVVDQLLRAFWEAQHVSSTEWASRVVERTEDELERIFLGILEVLDNLDAGVRTIPANLEQQDAHAYVYANGLKLIQRHIADLLEQFGLKEVPGVGAKFDSNMHKIIGRAPNSPQKSGTVHRVERRGYFYGNRLLRPAQVWVAGE